MFDIGQPWQAAVDDLRKKSLGIYGNKLKKINTQLRAIRVQAARAKGTHTKEEWERLKAEFDYSCVICGLFFGDDRITKDHIKPLYQGGSDALDNIQPVCFSCNCAKGMDSFNWAEYRRKEGF